MAKVDPITLYVERALQRGLGHDAVRAQLTSAGWPARDIDDALSGWADLGPQGDDMPPVPQPRASFSVLDLLVYLLLLAALSITAFNIVTLTHGLLEFLLPEALDRASAGRAQQARWALATLIVAAPVYGLLVTWIDRDLARNQVKRSAGVRRGALGLMLMVAAITFACDAIYSIYALLNGELTLRFILKALVVALVAGGVWCIGRSDLSPASDGRAKRLVLLVGAAVTAGLVVWTLLATGVPASVRDQRLDEQRFADIRDIATHLRCPDAGALPLDLNVEQAIAFCPAQDVAPVTLRDPETDARYRYERLDDRSFRICADFAALHDDTEFQRSGRSWLFDVQTGCITGRIR